MRSRSSGGYNNDDGWADRRAGDAGGGGVAGVGPGGHTGICLLGIGLGRRLTVKAEGRGEGGGVEWCSECC
jgi:hypothetical protein